MDAFLNAVEHAQTVAPRFDHRHTVEHSQFTQPDQYRRMKALVQDALKAVTLGGEVPSTGRAEIRTFLAEHAPGVPAVETAHGTLPLGKTSISTCRAVSASR